jgi:hypothetical protein
VCELEEVVDSMTPGLITYELGRSERFDASLNRRVGNSVREIKANTRFII